MMCASLRLAGRPKAAVPTQAIADGPGGRPHIRLIALIPLSIRGRAVPGLRVLGRTLLWLSGSLVCLRRRGGGLRRRRRTFFLFAAGGACRRLAGVRRRRRLLCWRDNRKLRA